jgi:ribosome-associated translation inhibitor RaiA
MRLNVQGGGTVPSSLRTYVKRGLGLALGRFADRIERAAVRFYQVQGENRCRIVVVLRGPSLEVEGLDGNPVSAVDQALSRISRSMTRALERERSASEYDPVPSLTPPSPRPRSLPGKRVARRPGRPSTR